MQKIIYLENGNTFEQIPTYDGAGTVNGVLNFRVEDISYYHTPKGSQFTSILMKGSKVYYMVKYDDLHDIVFKKAALEGSL